FKPPAQEALYEPNAYRASDHDPVLVGLDLLHYNFTGFFPPVSNTPMFPMFNSRNAGSAVPVKFSLGGFQGMEIFASGFPAVQEMSCSSGNLLPAPRMSPAVNSFNYSARDDQYNLVWKTDKTWEGKCMQLSVILKDGSIHTVNFSFR